MSPFLDVLPVVSMKSSRNQSVYQKFLAFFLTLYPKNLYRQMHRSYLIKVIFLFLKPMR